MTDQLAGVPVTPPADDDLGTIQLRQLVMPWADLGALTPPQDYLRLSRDVMATVSALVGQGPTGPKLLRTDTGGRLLGASLAPTTDVVTFGWTQFLGTFQVATPSLWAVGQVVMFSGDVGPGDGFPRCYILTSVAADGTCQVDSDNQYGPAAGALMIAVPAVAPLARPVNAVDVLAAVDASATLAANATQLVLATSVNQRYRLHRLSITPQSAALTDWTLQDTAGGFLYRFTLNNTAEHVFDFDGLAVPRALGVRWRNTGANAAQAYGTLTYRRDNAGY